MNIKNNDEYLTSINILSETNLNFNDAFLINNSFINSNANYEINKCMLNYLDNDLVEEFKK